MKNNIISRMKCGPRSSAIVCDVSLGHTVVCSPSHCLTFVMLSDSHIAIKAFVKSRPDELSLSIGDFVYVEESDGMGWMRGTCKTRTGWFPSSHVQRYKGASNDADKESEVCT